MGLGIFFILLFFWKLAFTNLILARGDTFLYFYPYWDYRAQTLLAGHPPLWNPYLFMGAPFLANSQAGVLYPLNWPLVVFPAPVAVKVSIVAHLIIAFVGAFRFARRPLGQSPLAALLSAVLFALGGYLTAQVEHINQLQSLAWFPWLLISIQSSVASSQTSVVRRPSRKAVIGLLPPALIFSLQLLAGHTQSAFISLAGASFYAFVLALAHTPTPPHSNLPRRLINLPFVILAFVVLAFALSAAQLLPTLELSRESLRGGGLPLREALSFSLDPRLLGRALLPNYSRALFSEFTAYLGVVGLALAALGIRKAPHRLALLALALVGLAFALGPYDPLYALLAALPPFNLFRVPARWLFLFAFAAAMLAGHGLDELSQRHLTIRHLSFAIPIPVLLALISPLANNLIPAGEAGPLGAPRFADLAGWALPLILLAALTLIRLPDRWRAREAGIFGLATLELFFAARVLPYNQLTTPEAYSSVRPAMTQLLADPSPSDSSVPSVDSPPARFLSMSALRFDPGDLAELHSELDPQLPPAAVYDFIVATKDKEVVSPNLPLTWGIPSVDGLDGGILPLEHYAEFTSLFTGSPSTDGRLRENLASAPDNRLLSLVNARYLITDKVGDVWIDDVFYDLQFTLTLADGETSSIAHVPKFQATALGLVSDAPTGRIRVTFAGGWTTDLGFTAPSVVGRRSSVIIHFDHPATPTSITLVGPLTVRGLSLIDERSGAFQSLTLGPYRLVHSGDVKIYDNLAVLPRAFVADSAIVTPDDSAARDLLADPAFDPASTVILASTVPASVPRPPSSVVGRRSSIVAYSPEFIRLTVQGPGYLVLTDAYYPGWTAAVDGQPAPILRADIMFRAIELPEGTHTVEFRYAPLTVKIGFWISSIAWAAAILGFVILRNKKADAHSVGPSDSSAPSVDQLAV